MAIAPQLYGTGAITADVAGLDISDGVGPGNAAVADLLGYRGAIVVVHHAPGVGSSPNSLSTLLRHGDTATYSQHVQIGAGLGTFPDIFGFTRAGAGGGGNSEALVFLVDANRVKRFLSVEISLNVGASVYHGGASIIPIGPLQARKSNLDQSTNLFVTASGDLTFPDLS